jgi:acyl carrier protein
VDAAALEESIQRFLAEDLRVPEAPVTRDCELVKSGMIDSMDLVQLATHLERATGISVPDADIHDEHFGSIERILAYAERHAPS